MSEQSRLSASAAALRVIAERVMGDGGSGSWLSQVQDGLWDRLWPEHADALAIRLEAVAEAFRHARALAGELDPDVPSAPAVPQNAAGDGLRQLAAELLPLNRKERYYTGTVLPGLVAGDGMLHLPRFLSLCGLPDAGAHPQGRDGAQRVEFFTEYSFADSLGPADADRFAGAPLDKDTPDLVLVGPDWLLAVEAKMFHRPSVEALDGQMRRQAALVDYWAGRFAFSPDRVRHVLLLPDALRRARPQTAWPVVTWEQVRDGFAVAGDAYWLGVLRLALERYDELASPEPTFGGNADARMTGQDIAGGAAAGRGLLWVGRQGGPDGGAFGQDVADGTWRTRSYELRAAPPPAGNLNWFPLAVFLAAVA